MTTKHAPRALEAAATREGRWWVVRVPELGAVGQARTVREIRAVAVEVTALHLNIPEEEVTVHLTVHVSTEAEQLWERARQLEEEARAVQQHAAELRRAAVRQVRKDGYKLDAAAAAFGVTTSRIQQLAVDSGVS